MGRGELTCRTQWNHVIVATMLALIVVMLGVSQGTAEGGTKLWLYPDSEDPRNGGHVVEGGSFTLLIENTGTDPVKDLAGDVHLVLALNDPALLESGVLGLPDGSEVTVDGSMLILGFPTLPCSEKSMPSHGVYPAHFTVFPLGDLNAGDIVTVTVDFVGTDGLEIHFDAIGIGFKGDDDKIKCFDISNPSGHDVTAVLGDGDENSCYELEVDKQSDSSGIDLGDEVIYEITVVNSGDCELTEVAITEDIPVVSSDGVETPAFTVTGVDPLPAEWTEEELVWTVDVMQPGAVVTATVTAIFDEVLADGRHVVNTVCATAAELDEPTCAKETISVGEVSAPFGGPGFWCNQIRFTLEERRNAMFSLEELELWLGVILEASTVFAEMWPVDLLEDAQTLLCKPQLAGGSGDRLARHLLTLWFNVASEKIDPETTLGELCPGEEALPEGVDSAMTIAEVLASAEADLLADADRETLAWWAMLVDFINNAHSSGVGGCGEPVSRRARHM